MDFRIFFAKRRACVLFWLLMGSPVAVRSSSVKVTLKSEVDSAFCRATQPANTADSQ